MLSIPDFINLIFPTEEDNSPTFLINDVAEDEEVSAGVSKGEDDGKDDEDEELDIDIVSSSSIRGAPPAPTAANTDLLLPVFKSLSGVKRGKVYKLVDCFLVFGGKEELVVSLRSICSRNAIALQ